VSSDESKILFGIFDKCIALKKLTLNARVEKAVNLILIYVFGYLFYLFYERCFNIFKELLLYIFIQYLMTERKCE